MRLTQDLERVFDGGHESVVYGEAFLCFTGLPGQGISSNIGVGNAPRIHSFAIEMRISVPEKTPESFAWLAAFSAGEALSQDGEAGTLAAGWTTDGDLQVTLYGESLAAWRRLTIPGHVVAYAGSVVTLRIVRDAVAGTLTVEQDGEALEGDETTSGTAPDWDADIQAAWLHVCGAKDQPGISAGYVGSVYAVKYTIHSFHSEAVLWLDAVSSVSSVQPKVVAAVSSFIAGCKADASPTPGVSNWDAMKSVVLLAGPDTFAGIAVPLKGAAPTFFNFVGGDYDPATGLLGDGSTKYIDSNRNNNADPQNNKSMGVWSATEPVSPSGLIGIFTNVSGGSWISRNSGPGGGSTTCSMRANASASYPYNNAGDKIGLLGFSRANSSEIDVIQSALGKSTVASESVSPASATIRVFSAVGVYAGNRISFYWIGEAVDLTALNARLTPLMAAIAAAHQ